MGFSYRVPSTGPLTHNLLLPGLDRDANPGDIGTMRALAGLVLHNALELNRLPVPAIEPEDPVGLGEGMPALNVGQCLPVPLSGPDVVSIELGAQLARGGVAEPHN